MLDQNDQRWEALNRAVIGCRKCPRLVAWREQVARQRRRAYREWAYWGQPVPGFGDRQARVFVVGLAPGAHGANRTGRMFTGDSSGDFLYRGLHQSGFANQSQATNREDGLALNDLFISAVCRCAPPQNRPTAAEIANCIPYLESEIRLIARIEVIVALGRLAFEQILRLYRRWGHPIPRLKFAHGAQYQLGEGLPALVVSYHPSRQNTQTGRLTEEMFAHIWRQVREVLDRA